MGLNKKGYLMNATKRAQVSGTMIFLLLTFGLSGAAFAEEKHSLEVADYLDLEQVADAQISPDGRQIIYTRRWVDQKADRWASALWIMDADGSRHRSLIEGANALFGTGSLGMILLPYLPFTAFAVLGFAADDSVKDDSLAGEADPTAVR